MDVTITADTPDRTRLGRQSRVDLALANENAFRLLIDSTTDYAVFMLDPDDDGHATLVQRHLRRAAVPANVVRVRNGQELLDYMHCRSPWQNRTRHGAILILLDLNMPRIGGLEALSRLKHDAQFAHIPIFILTTSDNPIELDQCYARGASACLIKPVELGSFGDMVRRLGEFFVMARLPAESRPLLHVQ